MKLEVCTWRVCTTLVYASGVRVEFLLKLIYYVHTIHTHNLSFSHSASPVHTQGNHFHTGAGWEMMGSLVWKLLDVQTDAISYAS